jgi:predicted Fe-Mo cluster-binding NifX family protein
MKICVSSAGKDMDAKVDERFGKAFHFLIIDTDSMDYEFIENPGRAGPKSGLVAAQLMLERSVEAVLSGCVGQNAKAALRIGNIKIFEDLSKDETLRQVVEKFKMGEYRESSGA